MLRAFAGAEWLALEPWFRKVLARLVRGCVVELHEHAVESSAHPPDAKTLSLAS